MTPKYFAIIISEKGKKLIKHSLPPNPRGHNLPSKKSLKYRIYNQICKTLTFWIFPHVLHRQIKRNLRYLFGIDLKPESFSERRVYNKTQQQYQLKYAKTDCFAYRIVSLGCDCMSRTIPTLWGIKPRKKQGEISYPFDLSNNQLQGIVKNLREDFANYFETLRFNGKYWTIPQSGTVYCHDEDCGPKDKEKIKTRFEIRINNLREVFKDPRPVIFINHYNKALDGTDGNLAAELYNEMYEIIKQKRKNLPFCLLVTDYSQIVPAKKLHPEIVSFIPDYLPDSYVWNYPEYYYSTAGLRFEKELLDTIEAQIEKIQNNKT